MARIRFDGVARGYPDGFRVPRTDLDLPDRSFTVLLGPSGSGKTTLLRLLAGLEAPDEGRILLDERDVTRESAERRGIGLVFQDGALFPHLSVADNVAFGLRVQGVGATERARRVDEMLALVGLSALADRRIARLSGGERSRVALARALAPRPRVLLLDEPLAALDRNLRDELRAALRRLHDELRLTTVLVTHDREEALALADTLVVLRDGAVVETGAPREVFVRPRTAFTARLLGAANVVTHGARTLLVPPNAIMLAASAEGKGTVVAVRFGGFHEEVDVRTDDGTQLLARVRAGTAPPPGTRVRLDLDETRVVPLG